jgi:hypothetical protein
MFTNVAEEEMDGFSKCERLLKTYGCNPDNIPTWETSRIALELYPLPPCWTDKQLPKKTAT